MNIAELFVNLGIKGADKTVGALGSVKKGLGEVSSMSIEAKAGILAALYGLEQMAAKSGAAGTGLTNFSALTGMSARTLQQWQYAARQAGVSGEELTGSMKSVQNAMTTMLMGGGAPKYMAQVSQIVGGLDPKRYKDTVYMMTQLQTAMQKMSPDIARQAGASFGLSEGTIAAMRRNMFNPAAFAKAPTYSNQEIGQLDKANIAWSNLGQKIEMAFGHLNAKHGGSLVNDISKLTDQFLKLSDTLLTISERLKIFQVVGDVFDGLTKSMRLLNGESLDNVMKDDNKNKKRHFGDGTWWMNAINGAENLVIDKVIQPRADLSAQLQRHQPTTEQTTINQNIIHHGDAKDTKAVKDLHRHGVNNAYRQRHAQRKGS